MTLAWTFSIYRQGFTPTALWLWSPLVVVLFLVARRRDSLPRCRGSRWCCNGWPGCFPRSILSVDCMDLSSPVCPEQQTAILSFAGLMSLLYVSLALWHTRERGLSHGWLSLALLAPLAWLALAYLLVNGLSQSLHWSVATLLAGGAYATLASVLVQRQRSELAALWLSLGANFAYALAVTMYFREATLTLALAAQLLSLSWLMKRYRQPWLGWPLKALLAVVVIRLTFNPWLLSYPAHVHWSLWTYGGATLFCALASLQSRSMPALQRWLEAATLQLLVLTLGAEVRYQLYDGAIFIHRYGLTEAAINTSLWAGLALAYYRRETGQRTPRHAVPGRVTHPAGHVTGQLPVPRLIHNPWWSAAHIGSTPVFNLLLLAYGLPVIMALLVARYHEPGLRRPALGLAGLALLLFAALEIRHLWQGGTLSLDAPTGDGELYTYSVVGLLMAVTAILTATRWRIPGSLPGRSWSPGRRDRQDLPHRHVGTGRAVAGGVLHGTRPVPAGAGLAAPADASGRPEEIGDRPRLVLLLRCWIPAHFHCAHQAGMTTEHS